MESFKKNSYLRNKEIRDLFFDELKSAQSHIFIISPWITDFVVDDNLLGLFEEALQRNVKIDISFGYVSIEKMKNKLLNPNLDLTRDKVLQSWEMAEMLCDKFYMYNNFNIYYIKEGTHEKIQCYDGEKVLVGSYNLLSYDGGAGVGFQGFNFRCEGGLLVEDQTLVEEMMNEFAQSMLKLPIDFRDI